MMSVPAINSVMPPSGSQPAKINSSPTANPSVSPIGLSVSPKISVIPPSQIQTSPSKPQIGVNHSSVPLSLVFENKVVGSQTQTSPAKPPAEKPKDLSPAKPTSNGVETSPVKTPPPAQQPPANKPEESSEQPTTNHSEERIPPAEPKVEEPVQNQAPQQVNDKTPEKVETNVTDSKESKPEPEEKPKEEPKVEKAEEKNKPQANKRKREQKPQEQKSDEPEPEKKPRRIRSQVLPYQSPLPELTTFLNKSLKEKDSPQKTSEEKLIVFYKNEFLAVRNAEGGFYLCQILQNVHRSSHRIRIRWLSQKKENTSDDGDIYAPDFYDMTDFECILTTVALNKMDKNMYKLPKLELERIENILKRALDVEKGVVEKPSITVEHPDGIDLSLYKDESQLQKPKKAAKRKASSPSGKSPKQAKKTPTGDSEAKASTPKPKAKSLSKAAKKGVKTGSGKSKSGKRGSTRPESKSKAVDQLKVSPPNEKARVVAKVLRNVDISPAKEPPPPPPPAKKPAKSKASKRSVEGSKAQKKKDQKSGKKKSPETVKEETTQPHHERRQGKSKHSSNNKNKKN